MKRFVSIILVIACISVLGLAMAGDGIVSITGVSDGGTYGATNCAGTLLWNNSPSGGQDSAQATTSASSDGTKYARATLYYTNQYGATSTYAEKTATGSAIASTSVVKPGTSVGHGYYAASYHSYNSDNYGSWSGACGHSFSSSDF